MKPGRNDPCHCGSGKKYKKCCLSKDDASAAAARPQPSSPPPKLRYPLAVDDNENLDEDSNRVLDLIRTGKLDEAEAAANALLRDYPDVHDGLDRLGQVYEARGDLKRAAHYYRQTVAFMESHDGYDVELIDAIRAQAEKLESQERCRSAEGDLDRAGKATRLDGGEQS